MDSPHCPRQQRDSFPEKKSSDSYLDTLKSSDSYLTRKVHLIKFCFFMILTLPLIVYISRKPNKKKTEKQGKRTLSLLREKKFKKKKLGLSSSDFFLYSDEKEGDDIDVGSSQSSSRSFFLSLSVFVYS